MNDIELRHAQEEFRKNVRNYTETELRCIEMINSFIAYGDSNGLYAGWNYNRYLKKYYEKLGEKRYNELVQGQLHSVKEIVKNVYTDSEGCSYNSIIWK